MYVSLIHFVVSLLSSLKHILSLTDQRTHASTFDWVRLYSEGKIKINVDVRSDQSEKTKWSKVKNDCIGFNSTYLFCPFNNTVLEFSMATALHQEAWKR